MPNTLIVETNHEYRSLPIATLVWFPFVRFRTADSVDGQTGSEKPAYAVGISLRMK